LALRHKFITVDTNSSQPPCCRRAHAFIIVRIRYRTFVIVRGIRNTKYKCNPS